MIDYFIAFAPLGYLLDLPLPCEIWLNKCICTMSLNLDGHGQNYVPHAWLIIWVHKTIASKC